MPPETEAVSRGSQEAERTPSESMTQGRVSVSPTSPERESFGTESSAGTAETVTGSKNSASAQPSRKARSGTLHSPGRSAVMVRRSPSRRSPQGESSAADEQEKTAPSSAARVKTAVSPRARATVAQGNRLRRALRASSGGARPVPGRERRAAGSPPPAA